VVLWLTVAYEDLYQSPTIVPENVRSLPLVFIVLAMAVRLAPEEWAGDDQTRKLSSLRLYWSCTSRDRNFTDDSSPEYPDSYRCTE